MISQDFGQESSLPNHPRSTRMALIASLAFNIGVGSVMGTPGVLLPQMKQYLGVSTEMASTGMLAIMVFASIFAPQMGALAVRRSLRGLLTAASLMMAAAWLVMFLSHSYFVYIAADALLLGPTMAITGSVLAPTLVTRWFHRNRGLAIGLVHLPIMVAVMPLAAQWLILHIGLRSTFLMLAALPLVTILPASRFIEDWPPEQGPGADVAAVGPGHGPSVTIGQMLGQPRFWALTLAVTAPNVSSVLLGQHLVSMAESWGIAPMSAAGLAAVMSFVGMAGTVALGVVADRIGGARTLVVMAAADCALWLCLLTRPSYPVLAGLIGMIGFFGAGAVPAISKAYADAFGRTSFSRAIGLMPAIMLPFMAIGLIGPGTALRLYGNYGPAIIGMVIAFVGAFLAALSVALARKPAAEVATA
ncbi:MAG: MFS transporter [Sphingomonadales bacterium]|nr:MFS transporter [Sphingomonadales bacterium]